MRRILPIVVATVMVLSGLAVFPMSVSAAIITVNPGESIQDAIDAASPGDTIVVKAGTYEEQLEINKDLTLKGQSGAVIVPPDTRNTYTFDEAYNPYSSPPSYRVWDPVIIVYGGTKDGSNHISGTGTVNVNIIGLEIDGQNKAVSGSRFVGILYRNAIGNIKNNYLHNLFDSDGYGDGPETFGIMVYGDSNVTIMDNTIEEFSRGGIGVNGDNYDGATSDSPDPTGKICYNTVYGNGNEEPLTGWWAENGIQIGWGATGEICGNTVTDCQVNNPDWSASGILVFGSGDPVGIHDNVVSHCDLGIGVGGDWGSGSTDDTVVEGNTVDDCEAGVSVQGNARNTLIQGNEIENNYNGIEIIEILDYEPLSTTVHCNNIYSNTNYGLLNEVSDEVDAEDNWWGDASGPTHSGNPSGTGDVVSDNVDYEPWGTHVNPCQTWSDENGVPDVTTQATVAGDTGGTGSSNNDPPIVKCKWEYDLTPLDEASGGHDGIVPEGYFVHDADPLTPGLQVAPNLGGTVTVGYYAVVTDPNGISTVSHVYADVWHPDGQFKYQIELYPVGLDEQGVYDKTDALALWNHVTSEHHDIITYQCEYNDDEIYDELNQELAYIYYGEAEISYCQPGGYYYVGVRAHDTFTAWSDYLFDRFWYIPTAAIDIDFTTVDYGSVVVDHTNWVGGDQDMLTPEKPTVRNIGNTPVELAVWQNDMQFGETNGEWNVWFDARLGEPTGSNTVEYKPEEVTPGYLGVLIPGVLDMCTQEKLDFSIHVKKGYPPYTYTGTLRLYAYIHDNTLYPWPTPQPGTPPLYVEKWYQDTGGPWPPEGPR